MKHFLKRHLTQKKNKKPNDPPHGDVWIERGNTKVYNIGVDPRKAFCEQLLLFALPSLWSAQTVPTS